MRTFRPAQSSIRATLALFVASVMIGAVGDAVAARPRLVLVVAKASPISNVTKAELGHIFSGEPIKIEGVSVVPFALTPASPERQAFDLAVLGMTPDEVNKYWIDHRIRGQGNPPKSAPSPEIVAKVVANFPGAMGYVPVNALTANLKPVLIDGKAYTDAGYLLAAAP
jgi:hypothetical protein